MIFAIEGLDGLGKTTIARRLAKDLGAPLMKFPRTDDNSPTGAAIYEHLGRDWSAHRTLKQPAPSQEPSCYPDPKLNALVFQALQVMNRMEIQAEMRRYRGGLDDLVLDRYCASGYAYGVADGLPSDLIYTIQQAIPVQADLTIILDAPVEVSFMRRHGGRDRYEEDKPFLERVRNAYHRYVNMPGAFAGIRILVDATDDAETVYQRVHGHVTSFKRTPR